MANVFYEFMERARNLHVDGRLTEAVAMLEPARSSLEKRGDHYRASIVAGRLANYDGERELHWRLSAVESAHKAPDNLVWPLLPLLHAQLAAAFAKDGDAQNARHHVNEARRSRFDEVDPGSYRGRVEALLLST